MHFGGPAPIYAVNVTLKHSVWSARAFVLNSRGDTRSKPLRDTTRILSNDERLALKAAIKESKFWTTALANEPLPSGCMDCGWWTIEARRHASYQVVLRWDRKQPIRTLGVMLVKIAGLSYPFLSEERPENGRPPIPPPGPTLPFAF